MLTSTARLEELTPHLTGFAEWTPPDVPPLPSRHRDRVETVVVPFSTADDSAVLQAVERFDPLDKDVLLVVHPECEGIGYFDLSDLALRFAGLLAGRYEVFTGHPDDPFARAGVLTRQEPNPVLRFVHSDRLIDTEGRFEGDTGDDWAVQFPSQGSTVPVSLPYNLGSREF